MGQDVSQQGACPALTSLGGCHLYLEGPESQPANELNEQISTLTDQSHHRTKQEDQEQEQEDQEQEDQGEQAGDMQPGVCLSGIC